jgi:hypothetical protein
MIFCRPAEVTVKFIAVLACACFSVAFAQTLSLRDEISPQVLKLAKADYDSMNAKPDASSTRPPEENSIEESLLKLAQAEIDSEGDLFSEKGPGANDLRLYYLLRVTRELKWVLAVESASGKSDNHLLSRAVTCDLLAATTISFAKFQGWKIKRDGPSCLDIPNDARIQEVNLAQQKLIAGLHEKAAEEAKSAPTHPAEIEAAPTPK